MKTKKLKLLLNIGVPDRKEFSVPDPAIEGQVVDLEEKAADTFVKRGWAVDATPDDERKWTAAQKAAEAAEADTARKSVTPTPPKP